MRRSPDAYHDR
jgi:transposase